MDEPDQTQSVAKVIPRAQHNVSRSNISNSALKVLYRLKNNGFQAFLVGGGVRDLLLGMGPKDFDVATDARPEQIRELFRNCRLIGRRFRLAHIRFGREIVEVATFRAAAGSQQQEGEEPVEDKARSVHGSSGRILRDNAYGSIEEDIWRRDFTANALYYNIADFSIWDFTSGVADVQDRVLRLIGDPETRYREDPVRMLRAIRFAAKLEFEIAPETASPIRRLSGLLADVPAARIYDETLKIFHGGHGTRALELLFEFGLFEHLFPASAAAIDAGDGDDLALLRLGLANTDSRIAADKPVTPMFLFAILLWPAIRALAEHIQEQDGCREADALDAASRQVLLNQVSQVAIPRRFSGPMRDMLAMQPRFLIRRGARAARFLAHRRFRAAYDFLLLRAACGQESEQVAQWWTQIQQQSQAEQRKTFGIKRRRRGRHKGPGNRTSRPAEARD